MKRDELLKGLQAVSVGMVSGSLLEHSDCFHFRDGFVYMFSDEVVCRAPLPQNADIVGAVPASPLLKSLSSLPDEEIDIGVKDGELRVVAKSSYIKRKSKLVPSRQFGLACHSDAEFPFPSVMGDVEWMPLESGTMEKLEVVGSCASRDEARFLLTCVHLTPDYAEASDDTQICRAMLPMKVDAVVRWESLSRVCRFGAVAVGDSDEWLHFAADNDRGMRIAIRKHNQEYPSLDKFLNRDGKKVALPEGLGNAVDRADVFLSAASGDPVVSVQFRGNMVVLSASSDIGWYKEAHQIKWGGEPCSFLISSKVLRNIVNRSKECELGSGWIKVKWDEFTFLGATG